MCIGTLSVVWQSIGHRNADHSSLSNLSAAARRRFLFDFAFFLICLFRVNCSVVCFVMRAVNVTVDASIVHLVSISSWRQSNVARIEQSFSHEQCEADKPRLQVIIDRYCLEECLLFNAEKMEQGIFKF